MAFSHRHVAKLLLAEQLLELAEHSSEIEMRTSLSRMYYAVYHVAISILGNMAHGEVEAALRAIDAELGEKYGRLLELRQGADYDPGFVTRQFESLEEFRIKFPGEMEQGRGLYERLRQIGESE